MKIKAMEEAVEEGKIRSIGVSNFEIADLENILKNGKIKPAVNQVEVHIGLTPRDIMEYCEKHDILIMAYSPNATGKLINDPVVKRVADKYGVSVHNYLFDMTCKLVFYHFQEVPILFI